MEDYCVSMVKSRKRVRDNSEELDSVSTESKRVRDEPEVESAECKRVDTEEYPEAEAKDGSSDVNKITNDILDILEESDDVAEIQDLDSVIKSFEEEIVHPVPAPVMDSCELGYLLEASDDELGLPPAISPTDENPKEKIGDLDNNQSYAFGFGENVGFENEISSYDSFGFGFGEEMEGNIDSGKGDFVTVGGLFDYSEASDLPPEFAWLPESLPAQ